MMQEAVAARLPTGSVVITPGLTDGVISSRAAQSKRRQPRLRLRAVLALACVALCFTAVAGQLVRLASVGQTELRTNMSTPIATAFSRPDLVDRNGRLLATDVVMPSLFADPAIVLDRDEVAEKLAGVFPDLDRQELREDLADKSRRFVWIRRGISPTQAQQVFEFGLPGLAFRSELRRAYPAGRVAGHVLGYVNIDNKGLAGVERHLDEQDLVEPVHDATLSRRAPLRLSLDLGVQHAVEDELAAAIARYKAKAASAVVMDVHTGEIMAAASLPGVDPITPGAARYDPALMDRLMGGSYELGSVFKAVTVAMALEEGTVRLGSMIDVRAPLDVDGHKISDLHPAGRPLSVAEVFIRSSNVGSGALALAVGADRQRQFLQKLGLADPMSTEAGAVAFPRLPERWRDAETVTVSYGHGIAVAPLQLAAASAALVNGGVRVRPTFLRQPSREEPEGKPVISAQTSARMRNLMRRNVTSAKGTGRRADVPGLEVGGKTGTAEIPVAGGYKEKAVISSFLGAFPMSAPKYVFLVSLFEPQPTDASGGHVTAGRNAAPTTAKIVRRIAPLLGVLPKTQ